MARNFHRRQLLQAGAAAVFPSSVATAQEQYWTSFADNTRYMALGDSLSAGYGSHPVTQGFVYRLAQSGAIDSTNNLLFNPAAVTNAASSHVAQYQVPQAALFFAPTGASYRKVVTLTVGGNDLVSVLPNPTPATVGQLIVAYGNNLGAILGILTAGGAKVYVGNLYDPKLLIPGLSQLVLLMNQTTAQVVALFPGAAYLVDLYTAFQGKNGLLLVDRKGSAPDQVHPTNAGHNAIADAFKTVIQSS